MPVSMPDTSPTSDFVHEGFFYASVAEYLAGTVPFVLDGLAAGEPVAVAVPPANLDRIAGALGGAADQALMLDMSEAGRNPGRIIGSVLAPFLDEHPGQRVRIIGEPVWAERSAVEYPACVQHEALVNVAFAGRAATLLCPYDVDHLDPMAVHDATQTHPVLVSGGQRYVSSAYANPVQLAARHDTPLSEPPAGAEVEVLVFDAQVGARGVRRFVHERAVRAGMRPDRIAGLRAAVHELAMNTLVHTGRPGVLLLWQEDRQLVCEVQDSGTLPDPLAGRRAPEPFDDHGGPGSGLYLVHELADLVRIHLTGHGLTVRVYMGLQAPPSRAILSPGCLDRTSTPPDISRGRS